MKKGQATHKQRAFWRHNSFSGSAAMMRQQCREIIKSNTTTAESKNIAEQIETLTLELTESLKTRIDK